MSLFTSNLTVPDSICAATLSLSRILKITEVSGGKSLGEKRGQKSLFHFLGLATLFCWKSDTPSSVHAATTVDTTDNSGHHWQQPAVQSTFASVPFPSLLLHPPLFTSNTTVQEVSWLTLHRKFYTEVWPENIKPALHFVRECKNGLVFLPRAKPLNVWIRVMPQVGEKCRKRGSCLS